VNLTDPVNAAIADGEGQGTILNNDKGIILDGDSAPIAGIASWPVAFVNPHAIPPQLEFGFGIIAELAEDTTNAVFTVSLSKPASRVVKINYSTISGTARAGADFVATSGTLEFAPGVVEKTIVVRIKHDSVSEMDEVFFVNLNAAVNAILGVTQAECTIRENIASPWP
jgi:hypothetical protein